MTFGEKMRMLRLQQKLTLEEVGERVGVGKSTVRKWESGQIANMRRDKIALVAKALNTTPAYLMGWDEDGTELAPKSEPKQEELIRLFVGLPADVQKQVLDLVRTLAEAHAGNADRHGKDT